MSAWTPDRVVRLKTLWKQGLSAAQIARDLQNGITRSAVLGKVYRLGLSLDRDAAPASPPVRSAARGAPASLQPVAAIVQPLKAVARERAGRATILTVRQGDCRWPIGDPGDAWFSLCGCPATRGAFCDVHAARAYRPVQPTPESLMALLGLA